MLAAYFRNSHAELHHKPLQLCYIVSMSDDTGWHGRNTGVSPYDFELAEVEGSTGWFRVTGGSLPGAIYLRIERSKDGRNIVTGMFVGRDSPFELTSVKLRDIRLTEIVKHFFAGYTKAPQWGLTDTEKQMDEFLEYQALTGSINPDLTVSVRPQRYVTDRAIADFARRYRSARLSEPHRAIAAVMDSLKRDDPTGKGISRATANRRLARAREAGLLDASFTKEGTPND